MNANIISLVDSDWVIWTPANPDCRTFPTVTTAELVLKATTSLLSNQQSEKIPSRNRFMNNAGWKLMRTCGLSLDTRGASCH
jgi:hypothetical protein